MFRILRNPTVGHVAEVTIDGKITRIDLSRMNRNEKSKVSHSLFKWRAGGYTGYPDIIA